MEQKVKGLLDQINKDHKLVEFSQQKPSEIKQRLLIGIFGTPGSGKTSVCQDMKKYLTEELKINCQVVPMDGFHYYRRELDMMEDPKHAHSRRGAPFTFNDLAFKNLLEMIKNSPNQKVSAPSFDHGVGDPIEDDIHVEANQSIVIVEGNYLATWPNVTPLFDILIYIHTQTKEEAMERVVKRHIGTGNTEELARHRVAINDGPNGDGIISDFNKLKNEKDSKFLYTLLSEQDSRY